MHALICPRCGGNDIRSSVGRGVGDSIMACLWMAPYRCRNCRKRFFRFSLGNPNAVPSAVAHTVAGHPLASVPIAYSFLIVSRDPAIRRLLCKLLVRSGYYTHPLDDAAKLLSELGSRKVDLLIIDLDEPEQQALETVASLGSKYPNLRIIALSGILTGVPGSMVLSKPFRRELLFESVQSALVNAAGTRLPGTLLTPHADSKAVG